jgi:flagellar basal-body rod protein FlgB
VALVGNAATPGGRITVPELSDAALVEALRRHMTVAVGRQVVASSNLANISTPGYRAKEVDFTRMLESQLNGGNLPLQTTEPGHLGGPMAPGATADALPTRDIEGGGRRDGNTVALDRELLTMTSAAGDFARAQTALAAKFRLLRYAINEGR